MILATRPIAFTQWEHFKIFCDKLAWIISLIHQDSLNIKQAQLARSLSYFAERRTQQKIASSPNQIQIF